MNQPQNPLMLIQIFKDLMNLILVLVLNLKVVLDLNSDLEDARRYYNTPAYEKLLRETNFEIEMLQKSIGEKMRTAIMN